MPEHEFGTVVEPSGTAEMKTGFPVTRPASKDKDTAAFKRAADMYVKKATASSKAANNALREIGTHTAKGELTKHYR